MPTSKLTRVRVEGSWRRASFGDGEGVPPYYVPRELARGELAFRDRYFEDNLEVRLALRAERRGEMVTATPGSPGDPGASPGSSTATSRASASPAAPRSCSRSSTPR